MLRVDELGKPAFRSCAHQTESGTAGGCAIHATRPAVCRGYRCLWLQGGLEEDERPDQTGGIVDLEGRGVGVQLRIQEVRPGAFDASPALQTIAGRYRDEIPVRIAGAGSLDDPDRPFRMLEGDGLERRVEGDWVEVWRNGVRVERFRQPWAERLARRLGVWFRRRALDRSGTANRD